jgi:hypothetical protein
VNRNINPAAVFFKALSLFVLINILYGLIQPPVAGISVYNTIFPGRKRMPFGGNSDPFTVMVDDVDVMFASHEISTPKPEDEIRVVLIGDSSIWGETHSNDETLSGQWNMQNIQCGGKTIKAYNLGYPHPSIIKDLLFIEEAEEKQPDAIVWYVTLNTLMNQYRINPFISENRERVLQILDRYDIKFAPKKTLSEQTTSFYDETILGQREFLARWLKLQALGLIWSITDKDTLPASELEPISPDVKKNPNYRELRPGTNLEQFLMLSALAAGHDLADGVPILLVNEPIFIATGHNSEIRYNDLYPRWAFDQYRDLMAQQASQSSWQYVDLWDVVSPDHFTDTPLHINTTGEHLLMEKTMPSLFSMVCK